MYNLANLEQASLTHRSRTGHRRLRIRLMLEWFSETGFFRKIGVPTGYVERRQH